MSEPLATAILAFSLIVVTYFVFWNLSQMLLGLKAWVDLWRYRRIRTHRNRALATSLDAPPTVSVIVPALNEAMTIVDSVRALLALDYDVHEILVVNDGSSDDTLGVMQRTFRLLPAPLAFAQPLQSAPVRGIYRSIHQPEVVLLDKENGGCKADALNAGINAASGRLVLLIDADTVLEPDALSRAVLPFLEDPHTVGVGGNVAIANGCRIERGRRLDAALPDSWLARFQIVEYMRSFLLYRVAVASPNALTIVSGAFGLFQRDALIAVGGYDLRAIGEDLDLTVRLQEMFRRRRQRFRIAFDPFPLCSTQVPEDLRSLRSQRCRWRRGLLQTLWRHRRMIGNPRFGFFGLGALPYVAVFEGLGPILEILGYIVVPVAALLGILDWEICIVLMAVSILFGTATTLLSVLMSDLATRRYLCGRDLFLLVVVAIVENCGYRQLNSWWGCVGTFQQLTGVRGWGVVTRRVFESEETAVPAIGPKEGVKNSRAPM